MKPQFLIDLLNVMKQYDSKEFDKGTIQVILTKWVKDGIIDKEELIHLTGTPLYNFTADICGVVRNLRVIKKEEVVVALDFIDTFKHTDIMAKNRTAELCGRSKPWLHNNCKPNEDGSINFIEDAKGVNIQSFLRWLKINNHATYLTFKDNFEKL